jgi:hypothetical protein
MLNRRSFFDTGFASPSGLNFKLYGKTVELVD